MVQISKTVDKALVLLLELGTGGPGTALEISQRVRLDRTVVHRLLVTLKERGFVRVQGGIYELGFAVLRLADMIESDVRIIARPALEHLANTLGETSILAVPDGGDSVVADQCVRSKGATAIHYRLGFRSPLVSGGHGRAILAFSSSDVVASALSLLNPAEAARIQDALAEVRLRGYAQSTNELRSGTAGLAVPIRNRQGVTIASIGIVSPVGEFPPLKTVVLATTAAAREVEIQLGRP